MNQRRRGSHPFDLSGDIQSVRQFSFCSKHRDISSQQTQLIHTSDTLPSILSFSQDNPVSFY